MPDQRKLSQTAIEDAIARSVPRELPPSLRKSLTQQAIPVDLPCRDDPLLRRRRAALWPGDQRADPRSI